MDHNVTPLERAFQLAKSGECRGVEDIRRRMRADGYESTQIAGPALLLQLRKLIKAARASPRSDR